MDKDEDDDLSTLLNAKVAEIGVFESAFAAKVSGENFVNMSFQLRRVD